MTLRKLTTPGVNPGGVDKLYGEDWNRLVDALTGSVAENLSILGNVLVGNGGTSYAHLSVSKAGFDGISVENTNSGGTTWGLFVGDGGLGLNSTAALVRKGSGGSGIGGDTLVMLRFNTSGDLGLLSGGGGKLYFDNTASAGGIGGDTYIHEVSANQLRFTVGGVTLFNLDYGASVVQVANAHLTILPTKRIYLDDGGDTYIYESSNNVLKMVAGSVESFVVRDDYVQSNLNFIMNNTKRLYLDGGGDSYLHEQSADALEVVAGGGVAAKFQSTVFMGIVKSHTADPTTANISDGYFALWKNTTANEVRLWANDGGTMKKSAPLA